MVFLLEEQSTSHINNYNSPVQNMNSSTELPNIFAFLAHLRTSLSTNIWNMYATWGTRGLDNFT